MFPDSLKSLVESFKCLPGIGEKTAERLAFAILDLEDEQIDLFSESILDVKRKIHKCNNCNLLTENDLCYICSDNTRENNILCVVEDSKSVFLFEKLGTFNGKYHVLEGLISPLDGINPENLNISSLIERIKKEPIEEVILALKPSIEGETTSLYISKLLEKENVKITKIAHGIPIGVDMEYIDSLTLEMALEDRISIS